MKNILAECEVIKYWKDKDKGPIVSVICDVYNHERYLEQAIIGFLSQKTSFPFEVIIHDDASTDCSREIINRYQRRFPNIIRPIFQNNNQYKRGIKPGAFTYKVARGRYIALCEGDDFWTSPEKLSKQIDIMEVYQASLSYHLVKYVDSKGDTIRCSGGYGYGYTKEADIEDLILKGGSACPTASLVVRKDALEKLPEWVFTSAPVGDYFFQLYPYLHGPIFFINEVLAAYRVRSEGSWSNRVFHDTSARLIFNESMHHHILKMKIDFPEFCHKSLDRKAWLHAISATSEALLIKDYKKYYYWLWRSLLTYKSFSRRLALLFVGCFCPHILRLFLTRIQLKY